MVVAVDQRHLNAKLPSPISMQSGELPVGECQELAQVHGVSPETVHANLLKLARWVTELLGVKDEGVSQDVQSICRDNSAVS